MLLLVVRALVPTHPAAAESGNPSPDGGKAPQSIVLAHPDSLDFQEIIVELRAGQEMRDTQPAYLKKGRVWVPALALCRLVEFDAVVDSSFQLVAHLEPGHRRLSLDPLQGRAQRDTAWRQLRPHELFVHEGELYASTAVLAWLLDTQVYEDLGEMTVTFDPIDELPLGRRLRRQRLRRLEAAKAVQPDFVLGPKLEAWSGATLDWDLSAPSLDRPELTSYSTSFGGSALGGGLDFRYRGRFDGNGPDRLDARWQGVWPRQNWLRQLSVGRTLSGGPRPRAITGLSLGNSPFLRSSDFGRVVLRGKLDPGWEVEVYRDGRLLAWDRVDERGRWEFVVPLDYGQNPVEIRAYGPHGELQITRRAVRVDFDRLPAHHFEYGLSAGHLEDESHGDMLTLDLRYGIDDRYTVRGGYEGYRLANSRQEHHPYLSLSASPLNSLHLFSERVAHAWWRGVASVEPNGDLHLSAEHTRFDLLSSEGGLQDREFPSPLLSSPSERERSVASIFYRPFHRQRSFFLTFDGQRHRYDELLNWRASWGATVLLSGIRAGLQWNEEWDSDPLTTRRGNSLSFQASKILNTRRIALLHGLQLRFQGELDTDVTNSDWFQALVARRIGRSARVELGGTWLRSQNQPFLTIGVTATGGQAYTSTQFRRDPDGSTNAATHAEGSMIYNPSSNRIQGFPFKTIGQGGISGTVFLDRNGDGILDQGESGLPEVKLLVGNETVTTDDYGRYSVWNLLPFEATKIEVQKSSLKNPLWIPVFEQAAATISPNGYRTVDLPLVLGVELNGTTLTRDGEALHPAGSVPVRLEQIDGHRSYETRSFHDGEFYLMGVAPGNYRVLVPQKWLKARGLEFAQGAPRELRIQAGGEAVELRIELEPEAAAPVGKPTP